MYAKVLWIAETGCATRREAASAVLLARILRRIQFRVPFHTALFHTKPRATRLGRRGRQRSRPIPGLLGGVLVSRLPQH